MASIAGRGASTRPLTPDRFERILAALALILLLCVVAAVTRGYPQWDRVPIAVWAHLLTIAVALALTPTMLLRRRGDRLHRRLGWVWCGAMLLTAIISFGVRNSNHGSFSFIHVLSVWTCIQVPLIFWSARAHNVVRHRSAVRGMVTGALLIAGFFTFPFDRMLGQWLFG